jgi:hypothetical protein
MKITIELPDDLYRRAEAEAALRGASSTISFRKGCSW